MTSVLNKLKNLTASAVLGTERAAPAESVFQDSGALGGAIASAKVAEPELSVLNAAALLRSYVRAGSRFGKATAALREPAHRETMPACNRAAEVLLARLLHGECVEVLPEALKLLVAAKQRLTERLIPALFGRAAQSRELRNLTRATTGERGRWLAAQNPDWAWVLATDENIDAIWQTGTLDQRTEALNALRASAPAKARKLLQATWAQEPPENRAAFIPILRVGLNAEDEQFLEAALDDKRKEVRRIAADLLARLPNSQLVQRMRQRVAPLLSYQAGKKGKLLSRGQKATIDIKLPEACDKAMQRDGIEAKPPHSKTGEKAWWVQQMIATVPPAEWLKTWSAEPADLIEVAKHSEWTEVLPDGWALASSRHEDATWIVALFESWLWPMARADNLGRMELMEQMMGVLPADTADKLLLRLMRNKDLQFHQNSTLLMLRAARFDWSGELSRVVVQAMQRAFATWTGGHDQEIVRLASESFCIRMSPSVAFEAEKGWPTGSPQWFPLNTKQMNTFIGILQFRNQLHKEIKA